MNVMSIANSSSSDFSGSEQTDPSSGAPLGQSGNTNEQQGVDYEAAYRELERKLGEQGNELGQYRDFFGKLSPLLETLDADPDLVQAIMDGKINGELVQSVLEGKISKTDAEILTKADEQVTKEVGDKKLQNMSVDQIEKLITNRTEELRKEMEAKSNLAAFEAKTEKFMESTPDFVEYADEIDTWLNEHRNITDIEVAYFAVKGQMSERAAKKAADEAEAERQKELAMNAGGGGVYSTSAPNGTDIIDQLVGGPANPLF